MNPALAAKQGRHVMRPKPAPLRRYAEGTAITAEKSRAELETLLRKHGATEFIVQTEPRGTRFVYRLKGKLVRHDLLPRVEQMYKTGEMPTTLLLGPGGSQ